MLIAEAEQETNQEYLQMWPGPAGGMGAGTILTPHACLTGQEQGQARRI